MYTFLLYVDSYPNKHCNNQQNSRKDQLAIDFVTVAKFRAWVFLRTFARTFTSNDIDAK